ncbi:hypothetical protein SAMN04488063_2265 [Halopelagius inordinatus]|uniref:DUF8060 domain-containing protein n=1 Tax=Halopelagius inordinatus TaxID=553467 RepID=A0A1I2SGY4_9EURY|nr:hypothetical protein [Halopelagius inordinatus]SFG50989.1 hypothetical protein SAMN04488063_2265 [Halopelagius inordinatus]
MTDTNADSDRDGTDTQPNGNAREKAAAAEDDRSTAETLKRYLNYAVLAGLILVALVSVFQLYSAVTRTIHTFVTPEYRAPFLAAFNLVVLLVAALGVSLQLKRLQG